MNRPTAVGLSLLFAAGCLGSPTPAVPVPSDPAGRTAAAILNDCRSHEPADQLGCHEVAVLDVLDREGVAAAMAVAERMGDLDEEVRRHGHVYAHAIGLAAYTSADEVGRVFGSCTAAYQSGCYHGVIQSYFVDLGGGNAARVDAEAINALCADQRGEGGNQWLLFQCAHGIGHGVTMLNEHHLPRSLAACDLVLDDWERQACYGGVFMENVIQATMPHHSVGRPGRGEPAGEAHHGHGAAPAADDHAHTDQAPVAGADAHDPRSDTHAHAHEPAGESVDTEDFPPLKADDPLYPCNVLEERYLFSCYQMQTSAILFFNGNDVADAAEQCRSAPERYRTSCFQSLGRDVSAITVQDHEAALDLCALAGSRRFECHWGYVKNVVDVTARADDGFEFCAVVPEDRGRRACYRAVGEQVWVLARNTSQREEMCASAGAAYVQTCREGAGLVVTPAPQDDGAPSGRS